jgi:hypothetical protein
MRMTRIAWSTVYIIHWHVQHTLAGACRQRCRARLCTLARGAVDDRQKHRLRHAEHSHGVKGAVQRVQRGPVEMTPTSEDLAPHTSRWMTVLTHISQRRAANVFRAIPLRVCVLACN